MGQAKMRGTREQRVALAVEEERQRIEAIEADRAQRWKEMSQAQKDRTLRIAGHEVVLLARGMSTQLAHILASIEVSP